MNMQSQLQAAIAAAEKTLDDSSVAPSVPGAALNDGNTQSTQQPVADVVVPIVRKAVKIKNLDEKAVLVQVNRRMYSPYLHDKEESIKFGAGNVTKHLFEGKDNIVKETGILKKTFQNKI